MHAHCAIDGGGHTDTLFVSPTDRILIAHCAQARVYGRHLPCATGLWHAAQTASLLYGRRATASSVSTFSEVPHSSARNGGCIMLTRSMDASSSWPSRMAAVSAASWIAGRCRLLSHELRCTDPARAQAGHRRPKPLLCCESYPAPPPRRAGGRGFASHAGCIASTRRCCYSAC